MNNRKNILSIVGIDTDGRPVIGGLFKMADTYGFSLSSSLDLCESLGLCPGFFNFIEDAKKACWPGSRIFNRIREACLDAGMFSTWQAIEDKVSYLCK